MINLTIRQKTIQIGHNTTPAGWEIMNGDKVYAWTWEENTAKEIIQLHKDRNEHWCNQDWAKRAKKAETRIPQLEKFIAEAIGTHDEGCHTPQKCDFKTRGQALLTNTQSPFSNTPTPHNVKKDPMTHKLCQCGSNNWIPQETQDTKELDTLRLRAETAENLLADMETERDMNSARVTELETTLKGWIKENSPGGWINTLREDVPRLQKQLTELKTAAKAYIEHNHDEDNPDSGERFACIIHERLHALLT